MRPTQFLASLLLVLFSSSLNAQTPLALKKGYIFLPMKGSTVTAGYGTLENTSGEDIQISLLRAEGFRAAELHETITREGMMKMQMVSRLSLKKGSALELKPGGSHIMLFDPNTELEVGDLIAITFKVKDQNVTLSFPIKSRTEPPEDHH